MARLFESTTGARVVMASDDHCPPHVHAAHRGEGWVVRIWFSFASNAVGVLSLAPTERAVRAPQINQMLDEVAARLATCRGMWWSGKATTCLENQWFVSPAGSKWIHIVKQSPGARQVRSARYEADLDRTQIAFRDGAEAFIYHGGIT